MPGFGSHPLRLEGSSLKRQPVRRILGGHEHFLGFHSNCVLCLKLLRPGLLKPLLDGFVQVSLIAFKR